MSVPPAPPVVCGKHGLWERACIPCWREALAAARAEGAREALEAAAETFQDGGLHTSASIRSRLRAAAVQEPPR